MAINKVVFANQTLIDISDSTIDTNSVLDGKYAYDKYGVKIEGSVVVQTYYTSSSIPSDSVGNNGDICLVE